jgi:hypothetical protein
MNRIPGIIGRTLQLPTCTAEVLECSLAHAADACPRLFRASEESPPPYPGCWVVIAEGGKPFPALFICGQFLTEAPESPGRVTAFSATEVFERRLVGTWRSPQPQFENVSASALVDSRGRPLEWTYVTAPLGSGLTPTELPGAYAALLGADTPV